MKSYLELNFGKSFTGKTARMFHEINEEKRIVAVDPKCNAQLATLRGWDHLRPVYVKKTNAWSDGETVEYFRENLNKHFRVIVHFRAYFQEQLELLCVLCMAVKRLTLAVDELAHFVPPGPASMIPPAISAVMFSGTHEAIKFTGTAQHPSLVNLMVKMNAQKIRWYRMDEKNALDAAARHLSRDFVAQLPSLPDYVCVESSDGKPPFRDESMVGKIKLLGKRPSLDGA